MKLGGFHVFLYFKGLSTYDYIMQSRAKNQVSPEGQKSEAKTENFSKKNEEESEEKQKVNITKKAAAKRLNNSNSNQDMENSSRGDADTFSIGTHIERRSFLPRLDLGGLKGRRNHP